MSLETVERKLERVAEIPFWKFLLFFAVVPALGLLFLYPFVNPTAVENLNYEHPAVRSMVLMVFTAMFLVLASGTLLVGIITLRILIKLNQSLHENSGKFIGKSLSTNDEFLRDLAFGLYHHLIQLIKNHNDPRFEELESKIDRQNQESINRENLFMQQFKIQNLKYEQSERRRISAEGYLKIEKEKNLKLEQENQELKKEKSEKLQTKNEKAHSRDITENSFVDKDKKFEEDL